MRRLRASFASSHSGGAGAPPGVTRDPCQELADTDVARTRDFSPAAKHPREARPGVEQTLPTMRREAAVRRKSRSIKRTALRLSAHRHPSRRKSDVSDLRHE